MLLAEFIKAISQKTVSGATSLRFSREMTILQLPDVASEALTFYGSNDYKETSVLSPTFATDFL